MVVCVPAQSSLSLSTTGDRTGAAGLPAGAPALRPSTGARAHPHPVPVRRAGVLRHGLPGAEEVHPPGPGGQVRRREHWKTGTSQCGGAAVCVEPLQHLHPDLYIPSHGDFSPEAMSHLLWLLSRVV